MNSRMMCRQSREDMSTLRLQRLVIVRNGVHQDCLERRNLHDERRSEMSLMLISVENATSMDSGKTDTAVCNNILESRAEKRRTVPSEFRKPSMQSRCAGSATPVASSRCRTYGGTELLAAVVPQQDVPLLHSFSTLVRPSLCHYQLPVGH